MSKQLRLIDAQPDADWRLDERTKQVGRQGVAAAREALRASRPSAATTPHDQAA